MKDEPAKNLGIALENMTRDFGSDFAFALSIRGWPIISGTLSELKEARPKVLEMSPSVVECMTAVKE